MTKTLLLLLSGLLSLTALAAVPPHPVMMNGKEFAPDRQVMLFLQTNEPDAGSEVREKDYERAKQALKQLYPWRRIMSIEVQDEKNFWSAYERGMLYLGNFAITNVVMLGTRTPSLEATSVDPDRTITPQHFRYQIGNRAIFTRYGNHAQTMAGEPMLEEIPDSSTWMRPFFPEIRANLASGASVVVLEASKFRVTGHEGANGGSREEFHQFYARLFGVRDGAVSLVTNRFQSLTFANLNGALNVATSITGTAALWYVMTQYEWELSLSSISTALTAFWVFGGLHNFNDTRFLQRWVSGIFSLSQIVEGKSQTVTEQSSRKLKTRLQEIAAPLCNIALKGFTS